MVKFIQPSISIFVLVALMSLFDGASFASVGSGLLVRAAPTPQRQSAATRNVVGRNIRPMPGSGKFKFSRQAEAAENEGEGTLGELMTDYKLLKAAIPATQEGTALQDALVQEVDRKKQAILEKFGQPVPDDETSNDSNPPSASTVTSADGVVSTIIPGTDGSIIITSDGKNQTLSVGPTSEAGKSSGQTPTSTNLSSTTPTSTSTDVATSTSTAPASGTTTTTPSTTASSTTASASASASRTNAAVPMRPLDILPTSMAMKSLFTMTVAMGLGAWSVL